MRRNLRGRRIVITRAAHQAAELADPLRALGAEVILLPMIGIAPPDDLSQLREAAVHVADYDWIIFSSVNAITSFFAELPDTGDFFQPRVATIGPATREVAEQYGCKVEVMPEKYVAESLAEAFRPFPMDGKRILIPSASVSRDIVPKHLRERGATVDVVPAYQNVIPKDALQKAKEVFQDPLPDWVTFASSSAVDHLVECVPVSILKSVKIASIGPITSATVEKYALHVAIEAEGQTIPALVEALVRNA